MGWRSLILSLRGPSLGNNRWIISSSELSVKNLSVLHTAWFWKQNEQKLSFIYKIISESHSRCKNLKYEVLVFYLLTDRLCLAYLFVYVCETESEGELGEGRETYSKQVWCIFKQRKSELEFVKSCHLIYHLNNYICCLYLSSERTQVHYKFLRSREKTASHSYFKSWSLSNTSFLYL